MTKNTDTTKWSQLLIEAVQEPGLISDQILNAGAVSE